jgi:hypothetical protein
MIKILKIFLKLYKSKMSKFNSEKELNEYISKSYRNNRNFAHQNKLNWTRVGDPILQRGEQYIPKEKAVQQCSKNYFQRMKEKESEIQKKKTNNNSFNLYIQSYSTFDTERKGKKRIDPNKIISNKNKEIKSHIKVYPNQYNTKSMEGIFDRNNNKNYIKKEQKNVIKKYNYKPSEDYIKMNNREKLLPSENIERARSTNYFTNNIRNNRDSYKETSNRIFGYNYNPIFNNYNNNIPNNNYRRPQSSPRMRYVNKIELKNKEDHINDLINYKFANKFRDYNFPTKINQVKYEDLINSFQNNIKENFVLEKNN